MKFISLIHPFSNVSNWGSLETAIEKSGTILWNVKCFLLDIKMMLLLLNLCADREKKVFHQSHEIEKKLSNYDNSYDFHIFLCHYLISLCLHKIILSQHVRILYRGSDYHRQWFNSIFMVSLCCDGDADGHLPSNVHVALALLISFVTAHNESSISWNLPLTFDNFFERWTFSILLCTAEKNKQLLNEKTLRDKMRKKNFHSLSFFLLFFSCFFFAWKESW